jgi:hypothetical protein
LKRLLKILLILLLPAFVRAQARHQIDSAHYILQHAANDTVPMDAYSMLGSFYDDINADSGLLSLSYDIIKAHRGELIVETKEGEGSEFVIVLPMNKLVF